MSLSKLVSVAEDGPWCGTRVPGRPPHLPAPRPHALSYRGGPVSDPTDPSPWRAVEPSDPSPWRAGPSPDPWMLGQVEVGLYAAIALYQLGAAGAAQRIFDDTCPLPISELIRMLLNRPPPPPPPWLRQIMFLADMARVTQGISQADAIAGAVNKQLKELLTNIESGQA
jgi:hypothetical protein